MNPNAWGGKVAWSNSTGVLAMETPEGVRLVSASTLQEVGTIPKVRVVSWDDVQWSPNDHYLSGWFHTMGNSFLRVWDVKLNKWASEEFELRSMSKLPSSQWRAKFGHLLVYDRNPPRTREEIDGYIFRWRFLQWVPGTNTLDVAAEYTGRDLPTSFCCLSTGDVLVFQEPDFFFVEPYEGRVALWDGTSRSLGSCPSLAFPYEEWNDRAFQGRPNVNIFSPMMTAARDGLTAALIACTPNRRRVLFVWDIIRRSLVMSHQDLNEATMQQIHWTHKIALSPRGRFLFVLATGSDLVKAAKNRLLVIDTRDGQVVAKWIGPSAVSNPGESRNMSLSPDGRTVVLSRRDNNRGVLEFIDVGEFSAE